MNVTDQNMAVYAKHYIQKTRSTRAKLEEENSLFNFRLQVLPFIKTGSLRRIVQALPAVV